MAIVLPAALQAGGAVSGRVHPRQACPGIILTLILTLALSRAHSRGGQGGLRDQQACKATQACGAYSDR